MDEPIFSGVGVALATFFDEDGEIDARATADHASTLVELGLRAVVVAGSTGEAASLAPEERVALLEAVRAAVPARLPVLAYHYPQVSPPGLPVEVLGELPVRGLKDSTGDPDRLLNELETFQGWLYVGAAPMLALAGPLGCAGAILALANAEPELCIAAFAGDATAQRQLTPTHQATKQDFPHGMKELVAKRFGTPTATRLNLR